MYVNRLAGFMVADSFVYSFVSSPDLSVLVLLCVLLLTALRQVGS